MNDETGPADYSAGGTPLRLIIFVFVSNHLLLCLLSLMTAQLFPDAAGAEHSLPAPWYRWDGKRQVSGHTGAAADGGQGEATRACG